MTATNQNTLCIKGYEVLATYKSQYVLAESKNQLSPEPFVVWTLDRDGKPHTGSYYAYQNIAEMEFAERCFPWFMSLSEERAADSVSPDKLIDFTEQYDTHRIGFYKNWMIVQPFDSMDGEILCYLPSDELANGGFDSLEYIKNYCTAEWHADNLQEVIDFIDSY